MQSLTIGEKIMIARMRAGWSREKLGDEIYIKKKLKPQLKFPDGRLKKIETGVIAPENFLEGELATIAKVLKCPVEFFLNGNSGGLCLDPRFAEVFPEIEKYFKVLNSIIFVDTKICGDIFHRLAEYVQSALNPSS